MARLEGTLQLNLLPNRTVQLLFMAHSRGANSRPLNIANTGQALSDLVSTWSFSPVKARVAVEELERVGHVQLTVTVEEESVSALFA